MKSHTWIRTLSVFALCSGLFALAPATQAGSVPAHMEDGRLVGTNGMTLYVFDKDEAGAGKSVCNGKCAENWPPLAAQGSDVGIGDWSVIARDDGSKQWAFKGKPVYFWIKDTKPGDTTGDGFNNVWHIAK